MQWQGKLRPLQKAEGLGGTACLVSGSRADSERSCHSVARFNQILAIASQRACTSALADYFAIARQAA